MYYVYVYLDPRKPGVYKYSGDFKFNFEPFYVGKGKKRRMKHHIWEAKTESQHWCNPHKKAKIKKIISQNLKPEIKIIFETDNEREAFEKEKNTIAAIGRHPIGPLTNMTDGGDGISGYKQSEETKRKIGQSNSGKKRTKDQLKSMSERVKGSNHPFYGGKRSEEVKKKVSIANSGSRNGMYGKTHTDKEKERM